MALTQWAVDMNAWITGELGVLVSQVNALVGQSISPSNGLYERLEILKETSANVLLHENAVVDRNRTEVTIATSLLDEFSLSAANAKVVQLTQYIGYIETRVLLDFVKYPTIAIT